MRINRFIFSTFLSLILTSCSTVTPTSITGIRSTAVYRIDATLGRKPLTPLLQQILPSIKSMGFNTVWIPMVWADLDPTPLTTPRSYNQAAFTNVRESLDVLRANNMKALIGLNYIGVGWAPDFSPVLTPSQSCDWAVNPITYHSFEQYVTYFLTQFMSYSDVIIPVVFTEGSEGCGQTDPAHAVVVATRLQTTLGNLPNKLPPDVRQTYSIGYHDYSMITLGWANGISPIANPNPFDWLSTVAYNVNSTTELDTRLSRWHALYPSTPMIIGEVGANGCGTRGEANQATIDSMATKYALDHSMGFSVWGWINHGVDECSMYGGLAITNTDGTPRQAATDISNLIHLP